MVRDERERLIDLRPEPEGHGLDFVDPRDRFEWDGAIIDPTYPGPDGRPRFVAIGWRDGFLRALVSSPLGREPVTAIRLRPASRKERSLDDRA